MTNTTSASKDKTGWRIVVAGTGGQGVITVARLLTNFFTQRGNQVISGQLHGMAQRGGAVQASLMIDSGISPVIPRGGADCVMGLEPVETVRALPFMSKNTTVFMNTTKVVPFVLAQMTVRGSPDGAYPEQDALEKTILDVTPKLHAFDATELARNAGQVKTLNIVMVGCLFGSGMLPAAPEEFAETVMTTVPSKLAEVNNRAFAAGVEYGKSMSILEEAH
jgi:indolepyruvate ferredoxin oxidoreductase, beta subunit